MSTAPIWTPDPARIESSRITDFARFAAGRTDVDIADFAALLAWSVDDLDAFWRAVWDYFAIQADGTVDVALASAEMPGATWFPGTRLNYVEQVFRERPPDEVAIIELDETGRHIELTWAELEAKTATLAARLHDLGVGVGDRVVAYLPNSSEAVIAFLATASLGAIWSACGMDYAPGAALGRFGQLEPVVLIAADGYRNGGKSYDRTDSVAELRVGLPTVRAVIHVDRIGERPPADALAWTDVTAGTGALRPTRVPFEHPLWVLFSSGTTGLPKGIVHGHGGVVLEHLKALALHNDLGPGDRFWWYTTPSWMMWNYQVAGLLVGATIITYDGSPSHPSTDALWALAAEHRINLLGTSPAYLAACARRPASSRVAITDLGTLRTLGVTGVDASRVQL